MEGMIATYICEARFQGPSINTIMPDHQPQIKLFIDDVIYQAQSNTINDNSIRKVYTILVDDSMNTKALKCEIGTTESKQTLTSSTVVILFYSVRNITYSPQEEKYVFGSNITCSARGNPNPLFEWRNKENSEIVIKSQFLNITEDMEGKNSWTCTARNFFAGKMYEDDITATFEAVSIIQDEDDLRPVFFLIGVGCFCAGILGITAYKRCSGVIQEFKKSTATVSFYVTTVAAVFGSSFPYGWNMGVLNIPQMFIKKFINESFTEHYGFKASIDQLEWLWALCVSIYLFSGFVGVFVAQRLADKFGRKYALLFCHPFGIIAAISFGFCKMAHSFELLIVGRLIIGFGCGAGSRLVLMYIAEIAPDNIQTEVLMVYRLGLTFGILLSQVAGLRHCLGTESWWPYLLSLTAFPSVASFLILVWFPQSPVDHLMKYKRAQQREHLENAKQAFKWFQGCADFEKYKERFDAKIRVTEIELLQSKWRDLYPCLMLLCGLNICMQLSGINVVFYYSMNVFKASGVPQGILEYGVLSTGVINVLMSAISMFEQFSHRPMLLIGMLIMIISSLLITLALHLQNVYLSLLSVNTLVLGFALGFGSFTTYMGRLLFPSGPRTPAITIARSLNWFANLFVALVFPVLHLRAGPDSFWMFTIFLVISIIYFYIKLPETKDRTMREVYKELEIPENNTNWHFEDELPTTEYKMMLEIYNTLGKAISKYCSIDDESELPIAEYNRLGIAIRKYKPIEDETEQEDETMQPEEVPVLEINEHHQPEEDTNQLEENPLVKNNEPRQPEEETIQPEENPLLKNNEPHQPEEEMIQPEENPLLRNNEPHQPEEDTNQLEENPLLRNNVRQANSDTNTSAV